MINKKTGKCIILEGDFQALTFHQVQGTGSHFLACNSQTAYLVDISGSHKQAKVVHTLDPNVIFAGSTRLLGAGKFRGVTFIYRIVDNPAALCIFAVFKRKVYAVAVITTETAYNRILSGHYDTDREYFITCQETNLSRIFKLTY